MGYKCKSSLPRKLSSLDMFTYRISRGPNGHALLASNYEVDFLPLSLRNSLEVIASGISSKLDLVTKSK